MHASPGPSSCDKNGARVPGFCSFLRIRRRASPPLVSLFRPASSRFHSNTHAHNPRPERHGRRRDDIKNKQTKKTTLSSSSKCGGVGAPPTRRCCLLGRSTRSVVGRIAPLLMETHGVGWAADSISQHAPRWARPAATRGLAPALARQRCTTVRGGCSRGGARGDGGGNE